MSWANFYDTFLNVVVFAFIGFLIWLYFKPTEAELESEDEDR